MEKNNLNHKIMKSTAYICRQKGSSSYHYKTIVPKSIADHRNLPDKCKMEWEPYGKEYIVRFVE